MPKFWAKDYLSDAVHEQRAMVERMCLAPPTHIEIVDCYAHKGEVDDVHSTMPWIFISPDTDFNLQTPMISTTLLEPVQSDLQSMMMESRSSVGHFLRGDSMSHGEVEQYGCDLMESSSGSLFSDNEVGERGTSSSSLTQEIDSAVEQMMMSSSSFSDGRSLHITGASGEEFPPERLEGFERNTSADVAELYLEEHETSTHFSSLLSALPTVSDLVMRLKPKLIPDPLLDPNTGKMYTYTQIFRSDFIFSQDNKGAPVISECNELSITSPYKLDSFPREVITSDDNDPVLELHIAATSPLKPLLQSSPANDGSLLLALPQLPSPIEEEARERNKDQEMKDTIKSEEEELSVLVNVLKEDSDKMQEKQLHFTSSPPLDTLSSNTTTAEFLKLNNKDVSRDSEDSGIGHAVLESPCVPLTSPHPNHHTSSITSSLSSHLARLEPIPVSPNSPHKLVLLSPCSEERLLTHIQEESIIFDNVLALTLPYTGSSSHLDVIIKSYSPLKMAAEVCDPHQINLTGDSELALPWDPLALSYHLMTTVQRAVVCLQCPITQNVGNTREKVAMTTESFVHDTTIKALGDELADTAMHMVDGGVPSINAVLTGYIGSRKVPIPRPVSDTRLGNMTQNIGRKRGNENQIQFEDGVPSPVDLFIMMRSGKLPSPEIIKSVVLSSPGNRAKGSPLLQSEKRVSQEDQQSWVTSPTVQDVHLNREYQAILSKVAHHGITMMESLKKQGLPITRDTSFNSLDPDDVKFFLKQQQKCLADSQGSSEEGILLQSCRLAACLYVLVSFADATANINLTTGLRNFSFLNEKYEQLIGNSLAIVKEGLATFQLREPSDQTMPHPKLYSMITIVDKWKTTTRKHTLEKAVVVVGNDFPTVSGDILDFLKTISDLKSCVFSFACDSPSDPLYLETVEERFNYYDCLVMPVASIAVTFPWEKVSLLVEYHPLGSSLFPSGQQPNSLRLREWIVLKTVRDISVTSLVKSGSNTCGISSVMSLQYTLIVSENVTNNTKMLQLLESRYNLVLISREYEQLKKKMGLMLSYADVIINETTGIIIQPMTVLSNDTGVHVISTRAAALSLQFERLWILLYAETESCYPYGGNVPLNLARLHASVAHYCLQQDEYQVKVMCTSGCEEAAELVRNITEDTRKQNPGVNEQNWCDREWIADITEKHEKFLLSFPCLNSFSAQLMLRGCSLRQLLTLEAAQMAEAFPWLPQKVVKFFTRMCHVSFQTSLPVEYLDQKASECWSERARSVHYDAEPTTAVISLDDSLDYSTNGDYLEDHVRGNDDHTQHLPPEEPLGFSDDNMMMTDWSCHEDDSDGIQGITSYPSTDTTDNKMNDLPPENNGSEVHSLFHLSEPQYPQELRNSVMNEPDVFPQEMHSTAFDIPSPSRPSLYKSHFSTHRAASQRDPRPQILPSTQHHFVLPDSITQEYYGNDPMAPRLLTSGMVRRASSRQPIKSLDLDLDTSKTSKIALPRLQTNDRAAALIRGKETDSNDPRRKAPLPLESTTTVSKRSVQRVEDLMSFHSRQSGRNKDGAATHSKPFVSRQKRPLSSSPLFDCRVPTHTVSPHTTGESLLYSSPNVSFGSLKLSPVRKKRLVYKRLPSSSDGQTKLAFE